MISIFSKFALIDPADAGVPVNLLTQTNVNNVANAVFLIAGIVAVLFVVIGGISYTVSAGDSGKISKAKDTILYAIVGLIVVLVSFVAVQFILGRFK